MRPKHEPKVTSKGTELPLIDLKGKPYLQVAHRIVWFREEHPDGDIQTECIKLGDDSAIFRATVFDGNGKRLGSGHKKETEDNFPDFIEKAETGAIGRALALAGYGTQFEPELDEGDRLADSPIPIPTKKMQGVTNAESTNRNKNTASETKPTNAGTAELEKSSAETEQTATQAIDPATTRQSIRSVARVLDAQRKLTIAEFKKKYLAPEGADTVDQLRDTRVGEILSKLKTEYPELKLA